MYVFRLERRFLLFLLITLPGEPGDALRSLRHQRAYLQRVRQERRFIAILGQVYRPCQRIILLCLFLFRFLLVSQRQDILFDLVDALADPVVLNGNIQVDFLLFQVIKVLLDRVALPPRGHALLLCLANGHLEQRSSTASDVHRDDLRALLCLGDAHLQLLVFTHLVHERRKHGDLLLSKLYSGMSACQILKGFS